MAIQKNVHALAISGQKPSGETCPTAEAKTAQQFLDVAMDREQLLFEEPEKRFIKECFARSDKILYIQNIANRSRNKWRRIEAILSLGYAEDTSALEIIKRSLYDKDDDISYFSMLALGLIKNAQSAKILLDYLKKNIFRASKIVSILVTFPAAIVDEIMKLTADADASIRFWSLKLISKFKPERYISQVEQLTKDASSDVRAAACECLGKIGRKEVKNALLKCLKDNQWFVRMQAVRALSSILGDEAMPEVIDLIKDNSLLVKESVKTAMTSHIEATLPFIEKILSGPDELAKKEVIEALDISGYIMKLLNSIISENGKERSDAINLLKWMLRAKSHSGIETALSNFEQNRQNKILEVIKNIDRPFAGHVEKKLKQEINEL